MEPPPLSPAPPITTAAPPPTTNPTISPTHISNYPDSVDSSPRSRNTDSWDEPPYGPTTTAAAGHQATTGKLRLMCSYGGHIVPRPHDKSLCYVGGDTRIIVADRQTTLSDLLLRLSKTLLAGKSFSLKYQLPNEDLDSLITVTTDEDFENMIDEYDRLHKTSSSKNSRLRLFLFPSKSDSEKSSSIESLLENSSKSNEWFFNALNSTTSSGKNRAFSETSSVNCLLGLDDAVENQNPAVKDAEAQLDSSSKRESGGISGKVNTNLNNYNHSNNSTTGQDVHSVPDSPMLETSSSFGSTSSSPSTSNLPPIKVGLEEGSNHQKGVAGLGIEEQFAQMNSVCKQEDGGFMVGMVSPPAMVAASGTAMAVTGLPMVVGGTGEYSIPNRVFSDDERSEQGVGVGFMRGAQGQPLQQQVPSMQQQQQQQQQLQYAQLQQNKPVGTFDLPSPDSVSSDGSVKNPLSRQKPMMYHEPVVQMQSANGRVQANQIDQKTTELNNRVQMPPQVQESGYVLPSQFDQYQQLQFVPAGAQYIPHHPPGAVPMYYPMYPSQHPPAMEHQYPVYLVPSRQGQGYNFQVQQPSFSESTPAAPSSRPQTPPSAALVPPTAFTPATNAATTSAKLEMAAGVYRTSAAMTQHLVQIPSSQAPPQYAGFSQAHHPSQSIAPSSAATANYAYDFTDPAHAQIYYTQPLAPQLTTQYQTITSTPPLKLPEVSTQLPTENIKQQVRTSQP